MLAVIVLGCAESAPFDPAAAAVLSEVHHARGLRALEFLNGYKGEYHLGEALKLAPESAKTWRSFAWTRYALSKSRAPLQFELAGMNIAAGRYSRAIDLDPDLVEAYRGRAWAYAIVGRGPEARADLDRAAALDPHLDHGFGDGTPSTATAELTLEFTTAWIEHAPDEPFWKLQRACALRALGRTAEARADFESAARLDPDFLAPRLASLRLAKSDGALDELSAGLEQAARKFPNHPAVFALQGQVRREAGQLEPSLAAFTRLVELRPDDARGFASRARVELELERNEAALADFLRAQLCDPTRVFDRRIASSEGGLAELRSYCEAKHVDQVHSASLFEFASQWMGSAPEHREEARELTLELFDHFVSLEPDYPLGYLARGILLQRSGRDEDALADFDRALELEPGLARALNNRGNLYAARGEKERAAADYERAQELAPDFAWPWRNLGLLLRESDPARALACFSRALELDPDSVACYRDRAWVYEKLENFPAAQVDRDLAEGLREVGFALASASAEESGE